MWKYLFIYLSAYLPIYHSIYLSFCLSVYTCQSTCIEVRDIGKLVISFYLVGANSLLFLPCCILHVCWSKIFFLCVCAIIHPLFTIEVLSDWIQVIGLVQVLLATKLPCQLSVLLVSPFPFFSSPSLPFPSFFVLLRIKPKVSWILVKYSATKSYSQSLVSYFTPFFLRHGLVSLPCDLLALVF